MKVLVADDDQFSRRLLESYVGRWGHEVASVPDGESAWELFNSGDFPIVLSDWMMPGMDGLELIRRIRASPRGRYVYAILLTAKSQKEDLVQGMEAGADDFLTKPFDRDELRVRLREGERIVQLEQKLAEQNAALLAAHAALLGEQNKLYGGSPSPWALSEAIASLDADLAAMEESVQAHERFLAVVRPLAGADSSCATALARLDQLSARQAELGQQFSRLQSALLRLRGCLDQGANPG